MSTASTKWNGIKTMLKAVGVKQNDIIYFGDDNDDIEPIKNCGVGVAVSNAIDEILDAADFITEMPRCCKQKYSVRRKTAGGFIE